jgi:hypothetical protein
VGDEDRVHVPVREEACARLSGRDDTFVSLVYPFKIFRLPPG